MSFSIKKYTFLKKRKNHSRLIRNRIYSPKLTRKYIQKRNFVHKYFLNEIGRKIPSFAFSKTLSPISFEKTSKNIFFSSLDNLQRQKRKKRNFMWFLNTAAPIPGVSFLKKGKKYFRRNFISFMVFKKYMHIFGILRTKQRIKTLNRNFQKKKYLSFPKAWIFFLLNDFFIDNSLFKRAFVQTPKNQRKFKRKFSMNGKLRKKKNFTLTRRPRRFQKPGNFFFLFEKD